MEKNNSEATVKVANRYVNHERISSIKSITMVFDRPQVIALLQLRDSMEKNFIKFNVGELDGDRFVIFSLLNTILMDIENIDEAETKWAGDKIMDERLAKLRNEEYVRKEEAKIAENNANCRHFKVPTFEYKLRDPQSGKFSSVVDVAELILPATNDWSKEQMQEEVDSQISELINNGDLAVVDFRKSDDVREIKEKALDDYLYTFGEIAIIQVKQ